MASAPSRRAFNRGIAAYLPAAGTVAITALAINEARGAVMALPVMWGMFKAGGAGMAIWLGMCSVAGIAISVLGPWGAMRLVKRRFR